MRLTELRKIKKISQKEFSLIFNVAQNTVSQWENGKRDPDTETLRKIADYFGVTTDYLLGHNTITPDNSSLEMSKILTENQIEKLEVTKDISVDDLKQLIAFIKTIKK